MKHRGATASFVAAAGLFGGALLFASDVLGMLSFGVAGFGVALLAPAAKALLLSGDNYELERRLQTLEARLRLTETELDAANGELARLRDERDFDRQLSRGN